MSYVTVKEAARALACSEQTVRGLVHAGHMPAVRVGRVIRIPSDAVGNMPPVVPEGGPHE